MAVPSAITTTANWKSSLGQKRAILPSTHGSTREPTTSISSTNATVLSSASARPAASSAPEVSPGPKTTGSTTKITTVARSSTMSHPVATRPPWLWYRPASVRFLMRTTVDAMLTERPSMMPASGVHPNACASAYPATVPTAICKIAPGTAMPLTSKRSLSEKCRPVLNIMNMTPTSDSWFMASESPMKPGVNGLTTSPPTR